jgi:hypothetical protein
MYHILKIGLFVFGILGTLTLNAQNSAFRRVLLFADKANDTTLIKQKQQLDLDKAGCLERDIRVEIYMMSETDKSLLKKYNITKPHFTFILIGKDGGIRLRSAKVIPKEQLFALIDTMPMRQDEIKRQRSKRLDKSE